MSGNNSLKSNSNYPPMSNSEWDNSPFEVTDGSEEIEVTVSITLSRSVNIRMYPKQKGNDKYYSDYDLREAVKEQCNLSTINIDEWDIDDFEVEEG